MRWRVRVRRWGALGFTVTALASGLWFAKHWAESRVLATVLGPQAQASAIKVHWLHTAACAENVSIPFAPLHNSKDSAFELNAERLWFTYDFPALLRKRLVIPRVIIEDALIEPSSLEHNRGMPLVSAGSSERSSVSTSSSAWLAKLRGQIESLEQTGFVNGTQVAVDADMLTEQWRAEFADARDRAQRILREARDIQQQIAELDNVLRHEGQVLISRDRLEALRLTLVAMKGDLTKSDRKLRDQQSRLREALLIEKTALCDRGADFRASDGSEPARAVVEHWLATCFRQPAQLNRILVEMLNTPNQAEVIRRGADIRFTEQPKADLSVLSTKMSGMIELGKDRLPFEAIGGFSTNASTSARASQLEEAHWQMSVGGLADCVCVDAHTLDARAGGVHVSVHSTAPGQISAECNLDHQVMRGSGQFQLRQWITQTSCSQDICGHIARQTEGHQMMTELIDQAISDLDAVPEVIHFRISGSVAAPHIEPDERATTWLSNELTRLASERVGHCYAAAAEKLDQRINRDVEVLNHYVATARSEAVQYISRMLDELRIVQANVLNDVQQRADVNFARRIQNEGNR